MDGVFLKAMKESFGDQRLFITKIPQAMDHNKIGFIINNYCY
jgi:hypothetical protein